VIATALARMLMKPLSAMLIKLFSGPVTESLSGTVTELLSGDRHRTPPQTVTESLSATPSTNPLGRRWQTQMVSGRSDGRR
jgi:hypothetical protein